MDPMIAPAAPVAPPPVGVVDSQGSVVLVPADQVGNLGDGFRLATPAELAQHSAVQAQGGTLGALKAAGQAAADTATFGGASWAEKELGLRDPVDIEAGERAHPVAAFAGSALGALAPLGAEELIAGAGMPALARLAGGAPGLIADAGEVATAGLRSTMAPTSRLGRLSADVISRGAGSAIEGAAYGLGQSVHEDALDPDLTVESAFSRGAADALLGAALGGATGAPLGLVSSALKELPSGAALADRLEEFQAQNDLRIAGAQQSDIARSLKKVSREDLIKQAGEARDLGILTRFNSPEDIFDRASNVLEDTGQEMHDIVQAVDEKAIKNPRLMPDGQQLVDEFRQTIGGLEKNAFQQRALHTLNGFADFLQQGIDREASRLAADWPASVVDTYRGRMSLQDLWTLRRDVSETIYGWRGSRNPSADKVTQNLQELRGQVSRMINSTIEKAGEDSAQWRQLNRRYQVASTMQDFSGRALNRHMGNNRFSLTETGALIAGATHGPLGLLGAGGYIAAKRYGPDLLSQAAIVGRGVLKHADNAIEKAAAAGPVASAELAFNTPERVAALAALERTQREALQDIDGAAKQLLTGKPSGAPGAPDSKAIRETVAKVNRLSNLPEESARLAQQISSETHEHAPTMTEKTGGIVSRIVAYLKGNAPQSTKPYPLGPELSPDRAALLSFHQKVEAVRDPIGALRRNPTRTVVEAIQEVYPTLYSQVRSAVIAGLAEAGQRHYTPRQREAIGAILGIDTDGRQSPALTAISQSAFQVMSRPKTPLTAKGHSLKLKTYAERLNPSGGSGLRNP
jgi:hypothetical protein